MTFTLDQIKSAYNGSATPQQTDAVAYPLKSLVQKYFNQYMPGQNWDMNADSFGNKLLTSYINTGNPWGDPSKQNAQVTKIFDSALNELQGNQVTTDQNLVSAPLNYTPTPGGNEVANQPKPATPASSGAGMGGTSGSPTGVQIASANPLVPPTGSTNTNRTLISDKPGPGLIKGYDTNNGYKQVYVPAGKYVPGVSLYPQSTGGLSTDGLSKTSGITVPPPSSTGTTVASSTTADTAAATVQANIKATQDAVNATKTATETKADTLASQISDYLGQESGKSAYTTQQTQALVDPLQQKLTEANNLIDTLTAQKKALQTDQEGKPVTMATIIGADAQIAARLDSQIFTATASANALMNNIKLAQDQVTEAVTAKYGPIDESLSIAQSQLQAIQPQLTADEKVQSDALAAYYADQKAASTALQSDIKSAMTTAIANGITDPNILNKITNATSGTDALNIVAQNSPDASVKALMTKYPDAGISVNDTTAQAQAKLNGSKIYQAETRLVGNAASGLNADGSVNWTSIAGLKTATDDMTKQMNSLVANNVQTGAKDNFLSPDQWSQAKSAWLAEGGNETTFDSKFSKYQNPNNKNYDTSKQTTSPFFDFVKNLFVPSAS